MFKLPGFRHNQREAIDATLGGKDGELHHFCMLWAEKRHSWSPSFALLSFRIDANRRRQEFML